MATANPVITQVGDQDGSLQKAVWVLTGTDTVGASVRMSEWADRTIQMAGTWNGATVTWEGSCDGGVTFSPLTDPQGNAISKLADSLEAVTEVVEYARPRVSSGAVTAVTVSVLLRRQNPLRT